MKVGEEYRSPTDELICITETLFGCCCIQGSNYGPVAVEIQYCKKSVGVNGCFRVADGELTMKRLAIGHWMFVCEYSDFVSSEVH